MKGKMTAVKKVRVDLGARSYEIRIGTGLLPRVGGWVKAMGLSGRAVIITDTTVRAIYAGALETSLAGAGFEAAVLAVPAGEEQKTLAMAGRLYDRLAAAYAGRDTTVLALGGGVIGDLAGFVAATYMRGVPLVHVPTTLLAQVDSSIGGKTAVDRGRVKNIIGVFYQPRLVLADTGTLKTLPSIEMSNGLAEAIKMAAIMDGAFFNFIEDNIQKALALDDAVLTEIVVRNARLKGGIVARDEKEGELRAILNFGHTIGHAVEAVSGYRLKHGQAVAIGMAGEARLSRRLGYLEDGDVARLEGVIKKAGLPAAVPAGTDIKAVMRTIRHDKKVRRGRVRFVLLRSLGEAFITDEVKPALVEEVLLGGE
jgi:3-dehydroquinate synthase